MEQSSSQDNPRKRGMTVPRYFTAPDSLPFDSVTWDRRTAAITGDGGKVFFEQQGVEVPASWSQMATNVVVSKYFRGALGTPGRERSVRQLVGRVVDTITDWGIKDGYFRALPDAENFRAELTHLLVEQKLAFNSPVWFNVGVEQHPQCSACFINSVEDTMDSILTLAHTEGMLFKFGSGTGTNFSKLRSSREVLNGGGTASGPVSFMRGFDAFAGVIKSGGKTRRAAKMVILNAEHPDIFEYVECKAAEERKAWALIDAGYDGSFTGEAYGSVFFQNSNNSVRVTDEFMRAVCADGQWSTRAVTTGEVCETVPARALWRKIAEAAHQCGDPGLQFDTTINAWHTCKATARINASNPCCFTGETLVDTVEGHVSFNDLHSMNQRGESLPMVFSHDLSTDLPVCRRIKKVWVAGETTKLVEVTTDKGVKLRCTPEHKFLLRDGTYVEAQDMRPGDRLRKVGKSANRQRNDRVWINHRVTPEHANGSQPLARFMWEQCNGPVPDDCEVHHVNGDCTDDRLSNLALVNKREHDEIHASGDANPRFLKVEMSSLVEVWEAIERTPKTTHNADGKPLVTPARLNKFVNANGLKGKIPLAGSPTYGGRIQGMTWLEFKGKIEEHRSEVNDSVASVRHITLDAPVKVYDMEVEGTHNFGVTDGATHSIVVSNSEYMFLDDSACNLASLNLRKFQFQAGHPRAGEFDVESYERAIELAILAQEIIVGNSRYPTEAITRNSHAFRPLGLGYANLGALLMSLGMPYDSDEGREYAAAITAIMGGRAYEVSARIARDVTGPFSGYEENRESFLAVIERHALAVDDMGSLAPPDLMSAAHRAWNGALAVGRVSGFRNAQVTVLAPTGTIGFMMDCDTTGIEPDIALVKYKRLVGGGMLKIVNNTVAEALNRLGYTPQAVAAITAHIDARETIEGAPGLKPEHLPVFDCAFRAQNGQRSIGYMGHLRMMAAVQPFLSGAISKTVNLPNDCTVEDIEAAYMAAWRLGLKAVAVYRDGCKRSQPLSTSAKGTSDGAPAPSAPLAAVRRRLPDERMARTHKFSVGGHEGYLHAGMYDDGTLGEIFVRMAKEGSTISGLMDAFATTVSLALQHGVPLQLLCDKFKHTRFEPSGWTGNQAIPRASSVTDYLFRWLESKFLTAADQTQEAQAQPVQAESAAPAQAQAKPWRPETDAPTCHDCGTIMTRSGACHKCPNCGSTSGCS